MPSKQDIAIAKGLAKEAGRMVAEELAAMLIPGIGWFTSMVSVFKLIKAMNDPGDESRSTEVALMVPQDARFAVWKYYKDARGYVFDFFKVDTKSWANFQNVANNRNEGYQGQPPLLMFGKKHGQDSDYTLTETQTKKGAGSQNAIFLPRVGFHRKRYKNKYLVDVDYQTLIEAVKLNNPEAERYENEMLAGAVITQAAFKVAQKSDLFDNDAKPKFNENNPQPLIEYGEALAEYVQLVNTLGTFPAGIAQSGDPLIFKPVLGIVASQIAQSFGLDLNSDFVTLKGKSSKGKSIRDIYFSQVDGNLKTIPGTTTKVDVSMPGSLLDKPAATPPQPSLPEAVYTIMPIAGSTIQPGLKTKIELDQLVKPKNKQPLEAPELAGNVSAAGDSGTKRAGPTDSSVLVLVAAAAAALALL